MIHRPTLEHWSTFLRPLFPPHAEVETKPGSGELRFCWPPRFAVALFIAANAVSDYLAAEEDVRLRADRNLLDFVKANLARRGPDQQGEFRIVIASIDFVPRRPVPPKG
jgi:hypothetical protein